MTDISKLSNEEVASVMQNLLDQIAELKAAIAVKETKPNGPKGPRPGVKYVLLKKSVNPDWPTQQKVVASAIVSYVLSNTVKIFESRCAAQEDLTEDQKKELAKKCYDDCAEVDELTMFDIIKKLYSEGALVTKQDPWHIFKYYRGLGHTGFVASSFLRMK